MSSQQTVTFQEAIDLVESLPEYQQDDLMHIIQSLGVRFPEACFACLEKLLSLA